MPRTYRLIGSNNSPYSVKMRALMRYRRLPFHWELRNEKNIEETRAVKPPVIPILQYPDGTFHNDSTPLAYDLDKRHPNGRRVLPRDAALAFLVHLIEDMADEWGVKCMFNYRWSYEKDQKFAANWIVSERYPGQRGARMRALTETLLERQVSRMPLVGCTEENRPAIEKSFQRILRILEDATRTSAFLFGSRPSLADFAWYGQLKIPSIDPTASALMRRRAPQLFLWLIRMDDASGVDGAWIDAEALPDSLPRPIVELLGLAGDLYLPFLKANAEAVEASSEQMSFEPFGLPYSQKPFRYQAKCYEWLKQEYAELNDAARRRVDPLLDQTGCLPYLAA